MADLIKVRAYLESLQPLHETTGIGPLTRLAANLARLALRLEDRLEWGPRAPLLVAVLGATGTGKSKIFNSLLGAPLSPSGYKRPTTLAPVFYAPGELTSSLHRSTFFPGYLKRTTSGPVGFDSLQNKELIVVDQGGRNWGRTILVDTPDFDSVLAENRAAAWDVFERADAVIFVTDAMKYADQASWDYLDRLRVSAKETALVVNRLKNKLSLEDFTGRLHGSGYRPRILSLPEEPRLKDLDLLDRRSPALKQITALLEEWNDSSGDIIIRNLEDDWRLFSSDLQDRLGPMLVEAGRELDSIEGLLAKRVELARERLARDLTVAISSELKDSLIAQIQALFLRWDLLRYPRRLMGLPFSWLRDKVLAPLGLLAGSKGRTGLDEAIGRLFEANRETLVQVVQDFNKAAREVFQAGATGRGLTGRDDFQGQAWSSEQVRARYDQVRSELEDWVRREAAELIKGLDLGEKMTFYLAQVVSLVLFISIQVHTGGGFSFVDGLIDGALAPLLSKVTGHALSREKVRAFEIQAGRLHQEGCRRIVETQARSYLDYLAEARRGLSAGQPLAEAFASLRQAFESLR
ncbi:MAG: GTPase [Thermodesulfobacteriota bacterium]